VYSLHSLRFLEELLEDYKVQPLNTQLTLIQNKNLLVALKIAVLAVIIVK
jgi:hypothetical protein